MKDFAYYLEKTEEVGYVEQALESIIYVEGLPNAHPSEVVLFESGQMGYVLSLEAATVEVLLLSPSNVDVGIRVVRTGSGLQIKVSNDYLGKVISSVELQKQVFAFDEEEKDEVRLIDRVKPGSGFSLRSKITKPLETGVTIVDLIIPLGKGQRQLVIGDRKTGKSSFLLQTVRTQATKECICIYAAIAKTQLTIQRLSDFFQAHDIAAQSVIIGSHSTDRPGLIFLTPYIAITLAEYYRDQGKDVIVILDDLTAHARYYREVMLLAKRFPGRSSYPGDIFYVHARLLERAGNFKKGSITCLPVAASVLGDLSGYIQSNLMSMTDGHILFDADLFDQGRRPAINPFLSVTRVGEQTQAPLIKDLGRQLRGFLVNFEKIKQFRHFQTELNDNIRATFDTGSRLVVFMDQLPTEIVPLHINVLICTALWANFWQNIPIEQMKKEMHVIIENYGKDANFKAKVESLIEKSTTVSALTEEIKKDPNFLFDQVKDLRVGVAKS
jgi:F-type H+-transporting ATPase subunit alpha